MHIFVYALIRCKINFLLININVSYHIIRFIPWLFHMIRNSSYYMLAKVTVITNTINVYNYINDIAYLLILHSIPINLLAYLISLFFILI